MNAGIISKYKQQVISLKYINNIASKLKSNALEYYAMVLLIVGLPVIALLYADWRLALSVCIVVQAGITILAVRSNR